jgi:hypothetical protein
MRTWTIGILTCLFFGACQPAVTFNESQPDNVDMLEMFPKKLQANYVNSKDNSVLTIQDKLIFRTYSDVVKENLKDIDSTYHIEEGNIISRNGSENFPVQIVGDSIEIKVHYVDTIFKISQMNVLKKFKGYYFLNEFNKSWSVTKLSLKNGRLSLGKISDKEDIDKLREVTETSSDTTSIVFNPTQKQFKQFIKKEGFGSEEVFLRLKR